MKPDINTDTYIKIHFRDNIPKSAIVTINKKIVAMIGFTYIRDDNIYLMTAYPATKIKVDNRNFILCKEMCDSHIITIHESMTEKEIIDSIQNVYTFFDVDDDGHYCIFEYFGPTSDLGIKELILSQCLYYKWDVFNTISGYKRRFLNHSLTKEEHYEYYFARFNRGTQCAFIESELSTNTKYDKSSFMFTIYKAIMFSSTFDRIYGLPSFNSPVPEDYYGIGCTGVNTI